jgi:hypothetical protein
MTIKKRLLRAIGFDQKKTLTELLAMTVKEQLTNSSQ